MVAIFFDDEVMDFFGCFDEVMDFFGGFDEVMENDGDDNHDLLMYAWNDL
jgi:hypothetical protein